jgi:hypothetical protein
VLGWTKRNARRVENNQIKTRDARNHPSGDVTKLDNALQSIDQPVGEQLFCCALSDRCRHADR